MVFEKYDYLNYAKTFFILFSPSEGLKDIILHVFTFFSEIEN